jgi:hypothetical protein
MKAIIGNHKLELIVATRRVFIAAAAFFFIFASAILNASDFSGEIAGVQGKVEVLKSGDKVWHQAVGGMPVQSDDRIKTQSNSSCNIELDDGSIVNVAGNTEILIESLNITQDSHDSGIRLFFGHLISNITHSKKTSMVVRSPAAVVAIRGTEFAVESSSDNTDVGVFNGEVSVQSSTPGAPGEVLVKPDEETSVGAGVAPSAPRRLSGVMKKYKERNEALKRNVARLRERLKRVPPEKRNEARLHALERFNQIKEKRRTQRDDIREKRENIKGK